MYIPLDTWPLPLRSERQFPNTCTALQSNDGIGSDNLELSDPEIVDNEINRFNTQGVMRKGCLFSCLSLETFQRHSAMNKVTSWTEKRE